MATGVLTNRTFLMKGTTEGSTTTYAKLVDITDFPNLGGAPEQIDITTLSDMERHYINGIQEQETMSFTALYNTTDYATLVALKGTNTQYAVWFGGTDASTPTGSNGKFSFEGELDVFVNGASNNEATTMTITIAPTTAITFSAS